MEKNGIPKLPLNQIQAFKQKNKINYSSSKSNTPDIFEDFDDQKETSNLSDNLAKIKKKNRRNNHKKKQQKNNKSNNIRRDKFGNEIIKGGKKHKIQFAPKIQEVCIVENWKMYNCEDYEDDEKKSNCCFII